MGFEPNPMWTSVHANPVSLISKSEFNTMEITLRVLAKSGATSSGSRCGRCRFLTGNI